MHLSCGCRLFLLSSFTSQNESVDPNAKWNSFYLDNNNIYDNDNDNDNDNGITKTNAYQYDKYIRIRYIPILYGWMWYSMILLLHRYYHSLEFIPKNNIESNIWYNRMDNGSILRNGWISEWIRSILLGAIQTQQYTW